MKIPAAALLVAFLFLPTLASGESRILFLDGARIEQTYAARKGIIEVPLPEALLPDSFRVKPFGESTVLRVEVGPVPANRSIAKKLTELEERREVLLERIKSLDEREVIFKSAAKSQSGRALRKTKTNPDPMEALRTGTRYALGQLDAVFAARRQTRKALAEVSARIAELEKQEDIARTIARVWLSKPNGKARVAYLVSNLKWTPSYDFRLSGNGYADITVSAKIPAGAGDTAASVVPLSLAESNGSTPASYPVFSEFTRIASFRLPLEKEGVTIGAAPSLSLDFTNSSGLNLPSGEATGYWKGEYFGKSVFAGCRSDTSLSLVFGCSVPGITFLHKKTSE
ncbi:MAG: hypothetical protein EG828_00380 [Deltaproteobacteria bacterium]|nr:hypothetical protein [Deltaproteobacteria bacterium]